MARPPLSSHDTALRDEAERLGEAGAPRGMAEALHPTPRPTSHVEEGEGGRNEWLSLAKAVAIGAVVVMLLGWLISA